MVSLSGVPGVGKSSAIRQLKQHGVLEKLLGDAARVVYVLERSDEWKEKGYLDLFYEDPDKNALAFQMIVYKSFKRSVQEALRVAVDTWPGQRIFCITERSVFDQILFWKLQCDLGRKSAGPLDDIAYTEVWLDWHESLWPVNHIFFCKTAHLSSTMQRLKRREMLGASIDGVDAMVAHEGDQEAAEEITVADGVPLDYQRLLYAKHEEWFAEGTAHPLRAPPEGIPCTHLIFAARSAADQEALLALGRAIVAPFH